MLLKEDKSWCKKDNEDIEIYLKEEKRKIQNNSKRKKHYWFKAENIKGSWDFD